MVDGRARGEVLLGICGGVGPAAGLQLHRLVLEHTDSGGADAGHLGVCHLSRSADLPDRSEFLAGASAVENPAKGMARTLAMLRAAAAQTGARLVVGVPCNTFHAAPIWDEFLALAAQAAPTDDVRFVHMLQETAGFIRRRLPACRRVGLMSTTGTRRSRVFHDLLAPLGYSIIEVSEATQAELHESIYNTDWGIKSTAPRVSARSRANFHRYALQLQERGAEAIVLGCTEIPFAFAGRDCFAGLPLIDPMVALARAMIHAADPTRLRSMKRSLDMPPSVVAVQTVATANVPRIPFGHRGRSSSLSSASIKIIP